jgi:hypothetical protein
MHRVTTKMYDPVIPEFGNTFTTSSSAVAVGCLTQVLLGLGGLAWITVRTVQWAKGIRKIGL